jgi:hypothetical protein
MAVLRFARTSPVLRSDPSHGAILKKFQDGRVPETTDQLGASRMRARPRFSGDHTGPMMMPDGKTLAPTKKHVEFGYLGIARIKASKGDSRHEEPIPASGGADPRCRNVPSSCPSALARKAS